MWHSSFFECNYAGVQLTPYTPGHPLFALFLLCFWVFVWAHPACLSFVYCLSCENGLNIYMKSEKVLNGFCVLSVLLSSVCIELGQWIMDICKLLCVCATVLRSNDLVVHFVSKFLACIYFSKKKEEKGFSLTGL